MCDNQHLTSHKSCSFAIKLIKAQYVKIEYTIRRVWYVPCDITFYLTPCCYGSTNQNQACLKTNKLIGKSAEKDLLRIFDRILIILHNNNYWSIIVLFTGCTFVVLLPRCRLWLSLRYNSPISWFIVTDYSSCICLVWWRLSSLASLLQDSLLQR